ncbi:hypothetical protein CMK11_11275 [Candidatus Poribacteria bacterium]|nr:hypothetical protein [Candidatus Poribacteria bacterium]
MSQTRSHQGAIDLPPRMQAALEQYRRRVWVVKLAEGALAAIFGAVVSYLLVFGLDRLVDTHALLRAAILAAGMAGMVVLFPLKGHNWVWRHRRLDQVARLLLHKFPRFGDHVLGIVELARSGSDESSSPALVAAAMRQVDDEVAQHDLTGAVPHPRHRRWAVAAGLPLALAIVGVVVAPAASRTGVVRWLTPWRDVARYTFAQLDGETGIQVVPYAEPFDVEAWLQADSPWRPASGEARYAGQMPVAADLSGGIYQFHMPPQTEDGLVALRVGDARRAIPVQPRMRPELTRLVAQVTLPAYLQRAEPEEEDVRGGGLTLVRGSAAVLEATATRDLAHATLDGKPQRVDGPRITTEAIPVAGKTRVRLAWRDQLGLAVREPQIFIIEARDDGQPTVGVSRLRNNQVLLDTEVVAFEIRAEDDFGVQRVGLEWEGIRHAIHNPEPDSGEKTVAAGSPTADEMAVAATFSSQREGVYPQSLRLRAFAEDYLPGRERAYSPYYVIHVLDPAAHFKWVAEQMGLWAGAAQEVYEKELQLHQTNLELRDLAPEALDDPAQRAAIQQQAAEEQANAARLDSLTHMGKELLEEAIKNEEFTADQLDNWAEMLKLLAEIAGERMPSVADLLAQAAEAPGEPSSQPPSEYATDPSDPAEGTQGPPAPPGGKPNPAPEADKYGPDSRKPSEGLDEFPDDPNTPGEGVATDRSKQPDGKPAYVPANPTPLVLDVESGFNESEDAENAPQVVGGLGIPGTALKGSGNEDEDEPAPASAAELVLEAVQEQQELLDAFADLAEEMGKLLMGFENSTFVKRLKAASRRQIDVAAYLNEYTLGAFGLTGGEAGDGRDRTSAAETEVAESATVSTVLEDMAAYADRRPSENYTRVLDEVQNLDVPGEIRHIATVVGENQVGRSIIEAEYWADTLDRWAEQLVDPLPPGGPPSSMGMVILPNLPPELVLEVMRILDGEMLLREETRELEQAKEAITTEEHADRAETLSEAQAQLAERARETASDISALPNAGERFIRGQLAKVNAAVVVMDEARRILARPDTGPRAIAAESEVIEILLETGRVPNAPVVVKAPPASASALMLMGMGDDAGSAFIEHRATGQATGVAGRNLPEEYRQGLDVYFDALEGKSIE